MISYTSKIQFALLCFGVSWNHLAVVPASTLMAIFFFGIEELAVQLEEPFSILPLYTLCDTVWDGAVELYSSPTPLTRDAGISAPRCVATSSDSVPVVELADHRVR